MLRKMAMYLHTFTLTLLLLLLPGGYLVEGACRGKQNYRVAINMEWTSGSDSSFRRGMKVGGVIAVTHKNNFRLFRVTEQLNDPLRALVEENRLGPTLSWLERLRTSSSRQVQSVDMVTSSPPRQFIGLNAEVYGDTGATHLSIMGALQGTGAGYFFATREPVNLCQNRNFTKSYAMSSKDGGEPFGAFNAGLGNRSTGSLGVKADIRSDLDVRSAYGRFKLTQGKYDRHFPFWKILVIVGVLATAILVAFICLYPVCCKKQMLDVPVPLQDESQWAT